MTKVLVLKHNWYRNALRRLCGWGLGTHSAVVLAEDQRDGTFYCSFSLRAADWQDAVSKISKVLEDDGAKLLEIDEWFEPNTPLPSGQSIARIGGRMYFGEIGEDTEAPPPNDPKTTPPIHNA